MAEERVWYYLDVSTKQQKGPLPTNVLLRLLEKGISGIGPTTLVWKEGMEKWVLIGEVEAFKPVVELQTKQWYYLDNENQQKGPIISRLLLHKIKEGELDGLSLVFSSHLSEWTKIGDIPELKAEIQKFAEEEARTEAIKQSMQLSEAEQIYFSSQVDTDQLLESVAKDVSKEKTTTAKKKFVSDDGKRYKWDEEEDCWVIDSDSEGEEDHEENNDHQKGSKKRSAATAGVKQDHDDSDNDEEEAENDKQENGNQEAKTETQKKKRKNKKRKHKQPNTYVYITGLPPNVTEEEIKDHFSKVGIIALNPVDQQPKIKIYRDELHPELCKGDGLVCYNAEESVQLALEILDGGYIRPNYQIAVTRASFDHSNHNNNAEKNAKKAPSGATSSSSVSHAQVKVARSAVKQALAWNEDDDIGINFKSAALKIVVLEGMFTVEEIVNAGNTDEAQDKYIAELEKDIAEEVMKIGTIEKMTIFTKNPRGVVVIKFTTAFAAQECIRTMNGRFFAGRKIKCYFWDGVTNYSIVPQTLLGAGAEEEERQEEERLQEFGDWLDREQEELPEEFRLQKEQ